MPPGKCWEKSGRDTAIAIPNAYAALVGVWEGERPHEPCFLLPPGDVLAREDTRPPVRVWAKPHQCDIKATPKPVDSQLIATPKLPQCDPKATPKPPQGSHKAPTMRPPSRLQPGLNGSAGPLLSGSGCMLQVPPHGSLPNPKSEARNSKGCPPRKLPARSSTLFFGLRISGFFRISASFGFRASVFGFQGRRSRWY